MVSSKNEDIGEQLRREEVWLHQLKDNLDKSKTNKERMIGLLDSFVQRLENLEATVLPLYEQTGMLQKRQQHINKALKSIDNTLGYYNLANEVDATIKETEAGEDLEKYIAYMEKLKDALSFFSHGLQKGNQLESIRGLYEFGCGSLEREFRQILKQNTAPIKADSLLECVDDSYEPTNEDSIKILPDSAIDSLAKIAYWLKNNTNSTDYMNFYAETQSKMAHQSLQRLTEARKAKPASGMSTLTRLSTLPSAGGSGGAGGGRKDSTATKISAGFRRKMSKAYATDAAARRATSLALENVTEYTGEQDAETFIILVTAGGIIHRRTMATMKKIFPIEDDCDKIQRFLLHKPFSYILEQGEALLNQVRKSQSKQDHAAMFCLFHVASYLRSTSANNEAMMKRYIPELSWKFKELSETVDSLLVKGLEEFVEHIKCDQDKVIPKDGTVHQITSNALMFLEQLLEFRQPLSLVLSNEIDDERAIALAVPKYFARVLSALGLSLRNKGELYNDHTLKSLFMLNNFNHILKSLQKSGGLKVVTEQSREAGGHYEQQVREYKASYHQCWSKLLGYIVEQKAGYNSPNIERLRDKERQLIKDGFAGFNKELEGITTVQRTYSVPDAELAASIIRESKDLIVPKYQEFYDKWHKSSFSKNPEKYVRYTPSDVGNAVDHLFSTRGR